MNHGHDGSASGGPLELFDVESRVTARGTIATARLGACGGPVRELGFEISSEAELEPIDRADGFFPIALLLAMREGRPLHVRAPLSPRLLYHANAYLGEIIHRVHPPSRRVVVTATDPRPPPPAQGGVCAGFSCGVDSFSLLDQHFLEPVTPGFRLTHLLFNDVGSHRPRDREGVFQRRAERVRRVATELGLPLIVTRSNQPELLGADFMQFDALRNVTVPLLLQARMNRFYYAAAATLDDVGVYPYNAIEMTEPALLPLLATEAMTVLSAGAEYTRIDKLRRLARLPLARRHLDVCVTSPAHRINCGYCFKCTPTLFTLELLGELEAFAHLFDMEAYRIARSRFIVRMLGAQASIQFRQVRALVRQRGYRIPLLLRLKAGLADVPFKYLLPPSRRRELRRAFGA